MMLSMIFYSMLAIILLFFIILLIKHLLGERSRSVCAICTAVTITWTSLLALYYMGMFENSAIFSILMGSTILGLYYVAENKAPENLRVFRLPFYITLFLTAYLAVAKAIDAYAISLAAIIWVVFIAIYILRNTKSSIRTLFRKIVECCSNW